LLIDLDPQGNATMGSGIDKYELELSVLDVLVDGVPIEKVKVPASAPGVLDIKRLRRCRQCAGADSM